MTQTLETDLAAVAGIEAAPTNLGVVCNRHGLCRGGARDGVPLARLLGNALTHGARDKPVRVAASAAGGMFELFVANGGLPLPEATREHLFQPFFRGDAKPNQEGLGLGLFIAAEIARAHERMLELP